MKVFVDTNILIDLVCSREDFIVEAQTLFAMGYSRRLDIAMSALSYVNAIYIGRKYGFQQKRLLDVMYKISSFTEVADLTGDVVKWAIMSDWKDFEDATQYKAALLSKSDCIVTRNKKDYRMSDIPVYTISELLALQGKKSC